MANSEVSIASTALVLIGRDPIVSFNDLSSANSSMIQDRYEQARDALLRKYPWNFAMRFATLSGEALTEEMFGYTYRAVLPGGSGDDLYCLKVWRFGEDDERLEWMVQNRYIYAKVQTPFKIQYIGRETNTENYDPLFVELLAHDLALKLLPNMATNRNKALRLDIERARRRLQRDARLADAKESMPSPLARGHKGSWLEARRPR